MKAEIQNLISQFAKENKYSKNKLESLVNSVMSVSRGNVGKPITQESMIVREKLLSFTGEHTNKALAEKLGVSPVVVNNNLRWLAKQGKATVTGKVQENRRGKPALVWTIKG